MRWFFAKTRRSRTKYGRRSFRKSRKNSDLYPLFVVACPILLIQNYLLPVFCGVSNVYGTLRRIILLLARILTTILT